MKSLFPLAVFWMMTVSIAHAQMKWPPDVAAFIERRDRCDHFRGEDPFDEERRRFLQQQTLQLCVGTDQQLAALKKQYQDNAAIMGKLNQYEVSIEAASARRDWPGLPPDCWTEPRAVHSVHDLGDLWKANTKITRRQADKPGAGQISPNKGYVFAVEGSRPSARVTIYAEKDYLVDVDFREIVGLSDVRWISEKLIFMRTWWGRIAAADLIFDVEREEFIYAEAVTDGHLAYQQYRESCPIHGCACIRKR